MPARHLKRDFQAFVERGGDSKSVGEGLLEQSKELFKLWRRVRDGTLERANFQKLMEPIKGKISQLLFAGTLSTHSKTRNTCTGLLKIEVSQWTFSQVEGFEPTNNQAERALRRAVLWRRTSFGTQSALGSRFVERILTVVTTLPQQCRSVFDYLCEVCQPSQTAQIVAGLSLVS